MSQLYKRCRCADVCRHAWWYRFTLHGRERRCSTRTANKTLAQRIAQQAHTQALESQHGFTVVQSPRLSRHIPAYCAWSAQTNRTATKDARVLAGFLQVVGDRRLSEITAFQVEKWKRVRGQQVGHSTVNRELTIVRGCFSRAVDWGQLGVSPLRAVHPYHVDDRRLRILSADEIVRLLTGASPRERLIASVTLGSLLRLSEVRRLHRDDLGTTDVSVVRKGGKVQRVPMRSELIVALLSQVHPVSGNVFGEGPTGRLPTQQTATNRFRRLFRRLGIAGASHHTLRHTGASAMLAAGHSLRAVQEIGGWASLRMLERYTHPTGPELHAAVQTLADLQPCVIVASGTRHI